MKQLILQYLGQIRLSHHPYIGNDENVLQKTGQQWRMIEAQQAPRGMILAQ